jgi:uncharacterized protein (DUF2147 family)
MIRTLAAAALAAGLFTIADIAPASAQSAVGTWQRADGTSRVRVAPCGASLCGTITWTDAPRTDQHNPDPALRSRSTVGVRVFFDMRPNGENRWSGQAYNPEDCRTYAGNMSVSGSTLTTQGCVMGGIICRSTTWSRMN